MSWPDNVGIIAIELYFPFLFVDQTDLEAACGEAPGKYTIGLGQRAMGFCTDIEDVQSLALTATHRLLERACVDPRRIGRVEVGSETLVDKSKSVKTVLMQLFEGVENYSVEGADVKNACFGGTQALFNAVDWVESSAWDGRFALVVAADIAVYEKGPARCTGGAGAIAVLVGPHAPIVIDRGVRAMFCAHSYDFYKPVMDSEYPLVDGALSVRSYMRALDGCYKLYRTKVANRHPHAATLTLADFDAFVFHTPFSKLVQKAVARLAYLDVLENTTVPYGDAEKVASFRETKPEETYSDRGLEKAFIDFSDEVFKLKTEPSLHFAKLVGNMYTPSVYAALVSFLTSKSVDELRGAKIGFFSYGSGLLSAMFSASVVDGGEAYAKLCAMHAHLVETRAALATRRKVSPEEYTQAMELRRMAYGKAPYVPVGNTKDLFPGTYYLTSIDDRYRREYARVPLKQRTSEEKRECRGVSLAVNGECDGKVMNGV